MIVGRRVFLPAVPLCVWVLHRISRECVRSSDMVPNRPEMCACAQTLAHAKMDRYVEEGVRQMQAIGATFDSDAYTAVSWVLVHVCSADG